jgi:glycosyltransferase involved in cell wall biosynthesis
MVELAVVIPVYNEHEIITEVIKDWNTVLEPLSISYSLNLYNDGSKDNSLEKLKNAQARYPNIKIVDKLNSGHGPTILQGYLDNLNAVWIFQADSDNEISAKHFIQFWNARNNYDLLIGYRRNREAPLPRKIITSFTGLVVRLWYGKGIKDVNCPYRLMRVEKFKNLVKKIPKDTFAPNVIVSGVAAKEKWAIKIIEVPVQNRLTGEVSIKRLKLLKATIKSFYQTLDYAFRN